MLRAQPVETEKVSGTATHCPYCAFQCGMRIAGPASDARISGDTTFPVNEGALCVKGWTAGAMLTHPDRLLTPLMRNAEGKLQPASWDSALDFTCEAIEKAQAKYGLDSVGIFGGGSLTNEKCYLLGKFARVGLRTSNIDYNGRFCMSSAAAASVRSFGMDRGLPFPLEDISKAEIVLLIGGNPAETMPPMMRYFDALQEMGGQLIVADPRTSVTAKRANFHLKITPGTDAVLANGLLHILIRDGLLDYDYIDARTEGFDAIKGSVSAYWPERAERITGIPEAHLLQTSRMLGTAKSAMILTGRGPEQQSQGVNNVQAFINIALALGLVGSPHSGYGCITGQGNGQGGREHGQKADQLPGYRRIDDPGARKHVAGVWGVPEESLPGPGKSAYEMLETLGEEDGVSALFVMGSNPAVSAPNATHIEGRLRSLDFLAVADFFLSETAEMADVVFPSAHWAEESGTITNLEGRVVRRRQAFQAPTIIKDDIDIICGIAKRLGKGEHFTYVDSEAIFEELARATAGGVADYSGISYDAIDANDGVFWPCTAGKSIGTPRPYTENFPTISGKARFHVVRHESPAEVPDDQYPLFMTTGRNMAQYQSGNQTRRVKELEDLCSEPLAEIHPATARHYGLKETTVVLQTRRGSATFKLRITPDIREDTVFVPFHWGGTQSVNKLTNPALDPISRMPEFKVCAVRIESNEANGGTL